jgi:Protein of unknown function (DUF3679)
MMKSMLVVLILFFGVLFGMQKANEGMKNMKGYDDPSLYSAFTVDEGEKGVEASVLGQKVTSHDLEEKKKQLEDIEAFNLFSSIGKKLSDGISEIFQSIVSLLPGS